MAFSSRHNLIPPAKTTVALAALWAVVTLSAIYLPDIGHGFIKDDYAWIASSHLTGWESVQRMFVETPMGFYRPLVSLSFAVNEQISSSAFSYAASNFTLMLAIASAIVCLAVRLGLTGGAALLAAAIWAFNFHGISMSLLWISGRTSLLGTLGAVLAACAFARSRHFAAGALTLVALLSKEEALLLPVVFALWLLIDDRLSPRSRWTWTRAAFALWPSATAVAAYLLMRAQTHALTPATAPDFYRLSLAVVPGNVLQYLDRSLTFPTALLLLGALGVSRARVSFTQQERSTIAKGLVWLVLGFAATIPLPVRSSLYVCLPTVGSAIAAAALGSALWRAMTRPQIALAVPFVLPIALWPVYHARNGRMKKEAMLAANVLATIAEQLARPHRARLVIVDDMSQRPSMADAFAGTLPIALHLFVPSASNTEVVVRPNLEDIAPGDVAFAVRDTTLVEIAR